VVVVDVVLVAVGTSDPTSILASSWSLTSILGLCKILILDLLERALNIAISFSGLNIIYDKPPDGPETRLGI
jgi:hypothetical protein